MLVLLVRRDGERRVDVALSIVGIDRSDNGDNNVCAELLADISDQQAAS